MPNAVDRILTSAHRRVAGGAVLRGVARGVICGSGALLLLLLAARLGMLPWSPWLAGALALVCVAVPLGLGLVRLPPRIALAARLDAALHLEARLATVAALDLGAKADPQVEAFVRRDAERAIDGLRARQAIPLDLQRPWIGAASALAVLALAAWLVPQRAVVKQAASDQPDPATVTARSAAAEEIRSALDRFQVPAGFDGELADDASWTRTAPLDQRIEERLGELARIAAQLDPQDSPEPLESRSLQDEQARAAALLDELSRLREEQALTAAAEADALAQQLSGLVARSEARRPDVQALRQFSEALGEGRLADAAAAAETLMESLSDLAPAEREAVADYLQSLAQHATDAPEPGARSDRDAVDAGDEPVPAGDDATARSTGADDEQRPSEGTPPEPSERAPETPASPSHEAAAERGASERTTSPTLRQSIADALRETAERARSAQSSESSPSSESSQSSQSSQSATPPDAATNGETLQKAHPEATSPENQSAADRSTERDPAPEGAAIPPRDPASSTAASPAASPPASPRSSAEPSSQPPTSQDSARSTEGAEACESAAPDSSTGASALSRALREAAARRAAASQGTREARELREQAERIARGGDSPGEGGESARDHMDRQADRWSQMMAREQGESHAAPRLAERRRAGQSLEASAPAVDPGDRQAQQSQAAPDRPAPGESPTPGRPASAAGEGGVAGRAPGGGSSRTRALDAQAPERLGAHGEDLDLRSTPAGGETIAQWFDPQPLDGPTGVDPVMAMPERVQSARRAAERAVDRQEVPSRYHELLRRYFDRFGKAAEQAGPPASGATPTSPSGSASGPAVDPPVGKTP